MQRGLSPLHAVFAISPRWMPPDDSRLRELRDYRRNSLQRGQSPLHTVLRTENYGKHNVRCRVTEPECWLKRQSFAIVTHLTTTWRRKALHIRSFGAVHATCPGLP